MVATIVSEKEEKFVVVSLSILCALATTRLYTLCPSAGLSQLQVSQEK